MQRLGRNQGRYHGDAIDIDEVQRETHELALARGWQAESFLEHPDIHLRAYRRPCPGSKRNLYVGTGIHGDEPSGPLAILGLLRANEWPEANLWLVPCVNPTGFRLNTRENRDGIDLNRNYRQPTTPEIAAHVRWLEGQPKFHLSLLLHEDWEANGFYVYELNPKQRRSLAEPMIEAVRPVCPIEISGRVDDFVCEAGIIRPHINPEDRPQWAEALYLITHKSEQSYTLETPSDYALPVRVEAHTVGLQTAFRWFESDARGL